MNTYEIEEIIQNSKDDSRRLYTVSTAIYKAWMILVYLIAGIGTLFAIGLLIAALNSEFYKGTYFTYAIIALIATAISCIMNYAIAVMATHIAKVLSNISLINLIAIDQKSEHTKNVTYQNTQNQHVEPNNIKDSPSNTITTNANKPFSAPPVIQNTQIKHKKCPTCLSNIDGNYNVCPQCNHDFINKLPPKPKFGE